MRITKKDWSNYVSALARINKTAAEKMQKWIDIHGIDDTEALIEYAYSLTSTYGEAAASLACDMHDAVAQAQNVNVRPAEPVEMKPANYVGAAVRDKSAALIPATVGEIVKRAGAETTLKNALRDGAYFAWIPNGDTCAFCITLASRGWQKASKKSIRNGHAEHIHKNCDCEYAVSFGGPGNVEGYNPDEYLAMYEAAEGSTFVEKINSLRRAQNTNGKKTIDLNKNKKEQITIPTNNPQKTYASNAVDVTKKYIQDAQPNSGFVDYEKGFNKEERPNEMNAAIWLHENFGGDIILLEEKNIYKVKNPDYEWMGELWDLKNTSTSESANSAVKSGMKQIRTNPGGIILDFGNNEIDINEILKVIDKRMQWYPKECADILIIANGKLVKALRY